MNLNETLQILTAPLCFWRESQTGDLFCGLATMRNRYTLSLHFGESAEQLSAELPAIYSDRHDWWRQWNMPLGSILMLSVAHMI